MNKKDKKFIAALAFMQTGVLMAFISVSAYFWHYSMINVFKMKSLYELSQWVNQENKKISSEIKIENLKQHYETQGLEVEE